ncbi:hypothetical protein [Ralstonia mannitolilytica]|uniref:DUF1364 domain-containing protein n=1 Tax=Ralstonia mannitolilytica TaxID=105219 RepID=A0AAD2ENN4_9RALS|nr:hypothetical protein [Ralstonia mannitolilytica]MBY4721443.1 hypothetical protein [Ralstonia mannitolilytica]CAJ0698043.1 hypothetical protein R77591_04908 [Ralstonia mannitolilytica]
MTYRDRKLLSVIHELPCMNCGIHGMTQAAHRNEGKGMGIKTSDALVAALCVDCHRELDSGKNWLREERRDFWNRMYVKTMQQLIERGLIEVAK